MDPSQKELSAVQRLPSVLTTSVRSDNIKKSISGGLTVETIKLRPSNVVLSRFDETMPFTAPNLESKLYRASSLIASKPHLSYASSRSGRGSLRSQSMSQNSISGLKTARMSAGDLGNLVSKMLPSLGDSANLSDTTNGFLSGTCESHCVLHDIAARKHHLEILLGTVFLLFLIVGISLMVTGFSYSEHHRLTLSVCGVILLFVGIVGTVKIAYSLFFKNKQNMEKRIRSREMLKSKFEKLLAEDEERELTATLNERSVVKLTS